MGLTLLTLAGFFAPLRGLMAARPSASGHHAPRAQRLVAPPARHSRPLRIVRIVEPSRAAADAGRIRISGRMADVCAELDRLAAQEAASH